MLETMPVIASSGPRQFSLDYVRQLERELVLASNLQVDLLPLVGRANPRLDLDVRSAPASIVGGDFYDFVRYRGKAVSAGALGDVTGKGASAALYAALVTGIMRSLQDQELSPRAMLEALNRALLQRPVESHFVSLIYATWDERDRCFTIANSGLPYPIWIHNGRQKQVEVGGLPLGTLPGVQYDETVLRCCPGDVLVFYTDGITDALNAREEDFGLARLEEIVQAHRTEGASQIVNAICEAVAVHASEMKPFDDQTVIVARV
jgi:phosphoserine phosphatase RsbU/P